MTGGLLPAAWGVGGVCACPWVCLQLITPWHIPERVSVQLTWVREGCVASAPRGGAVESLSVGSAAEGEENCECV